MKVLMLSIDRKIFEEGSKVRSRMIEYGNLVDELHIVVYTWSGFERVNLSQNVFVYPTNSLIKPIYFFDAYQIGKKIIAGEDFLITSQEAMTNFVAVALQKRFSMPLQVQIHTDFLSPYFRKESVKNYLRYLGYKYGVVHANCTRVVSNRILKSLKERFTLRSEPFLLPLFTDNERLVTMRSSFDMHRKYPQFDFIVLMVSRFEREKNIPLALRAFENVCKRFSKTGLLIVGEGREENRIKKLVSKLKLSDNVIFERWSNDIAPYYSSADVFLNTSNYEGYGLTLVEAASTGCPIITTNVGIIGDVFTESDALICPVGDGACIKRCIIRMIEDLDLRKELARQAQDAVQKNVIAQREIYLQKYKESFEKCFRSRQH